jgi:hypothetical protein
VQQHDLRQRAREVGEEPVAALDLCVALAQGVEQPVYCLCKSADIVIFAVPSRGQPSTDGCIAGDGDKLEIQIGELPPQAPFVAPEQNSTGRRRREQRGQHERDQGR